MGGGLFVVLEGPEGAGKSTQARLLADWLRGDGFDVVETREPGGTAIGDQIRAILLDQGNYAMLAQTEALLYAAARAQHVGEVLRPALARGAVIVCDRFVDSSLAYQAGGRGLAMEDLRAIQRFATGGLAPDLRVLLDLPVAVGLARRFAERGQVNRLDVADQAFHERVRAAYLDLARSEPQGWLVVDAQAPVAAIADRIAVAVGAQLKAVRHPRS